MGPARAAMKAAAPAEASGRGSRPATDDVASRVMLGPPLRLHASYTRTHARTHARTRARARAHTHTHTHCMGSTQMSGMRSRCSSESADSD
jgi:hypothetical protein